MRAVGVAGRVGGGEEGRERGGVGGGAVNKLLHYGEGKTD